MYIKDKTNVPQENAQRPVYFGKAENQLDPKAARPFKDSKAKKQNQQKQHWKAPANLPQEIPKGSQTHDAQKNAITTKSSADDSVFARNLVVRENVPHTRFNVSSPALIELSRQTYSELLTDDTNLSKVLLPEYIDYYATCAVWFRMVSLKFPATNPGRV